MRVPGTLLACGLALAAVQIACAQSGNLNAPKTIVAGDGFSISTSGSGNGTLYIVGPAQAISRKVTLGEVVSYPPGTLFNAGQYLVILAGGSSTENSVLNVTPAFDPSELSFLARPSRLPVSLHNGISGAVYVFDAYHNLITQPMPVFFDLSNPSSPAQESKAETNNGAAWTQMDSTPKEGNDKFVVRVGDVSSSRIVQQVPGDPCRLTITAKPDGGKLQLQTAPVRDCSGNAVPDGTIVTFTEDYNGAQSTVDVPLKRGIAEVTMPAHPGARISVASGVVLGNEIHWE